MVPRVDLQFVIAVWPDQLTSFFKGKKYVCILEIIIHESTYVIEFYYQRKTVTNRYTCNFNMDNFIALLSASHRDHIN